MLNDVLIGRKVTKLIGVEDYFQIYLDDDTIINLYNPTKITGIILEHIIISVLCGDKFTFILDNRSIVETDLSDSAYRGPEAFSIVNSEKGVYIVQ
jgi:hypothetical protein